MPPQTTTTSSEWAASATTSSSPDDISPVDRLAYRLRSHNVEFTLHPTPDTSPSNDDDGDETCKTLIWKATTTTTSTSTKDDASNREQEETSFFYFCTALRLRDRIDQSLLRRVLRQYKASKNDQTTLAGLSLAERDAAESLTGYPTGTIPPFGHQLPLLTVMDPALLKSSTSPSPSYVCTGCGDASLDLRLTTTELVRFAQLTAHVLVQPITAAGLQMADQDKPEGDLTQPSQQSTNDDDDNNDDNARGKSCRKKQPKPLSAAWWDKTLAKRLRDVAGREDYHHLIPDCIEEAGDDLPTLLYGGPDETYTKTPVHNAAWRGTPAALDLFLEAGQRLGHDFLNILARGPGNHGKTPIFYALTRSREEMVAHCLNKGANLLIVNNKGQTPCSLAVSHVSPELNARMRAFEEAQLRAGGTFQNFRVSHSDGQKYGDLDPRFPIDENNMGDDLKQALEDFRNKLDSLPKVQGIPVGDGFPRSIRRTTNEIRSAMACERWGKTPKLKYLMQHQQSSVTTGSSSTGNITPSKRVNNKQKKSPQPVTLPPIDLDELETLKLSDTVADPENNVMLVDDLPSLQHFERAVDAAVENVEQLAQSQSPPSDRDLAQHAWGVDAEWRPTSMSNEHCPVAVLQLCSPQDEIFLFDLQTLCQSSDGNPELQPSSLELFLSVTLTKLFQCTDSSLVGFGIVQDLGKLAHSFPHLPCFHLFASVIDLQKVAPKALDDRRITSLQNYVAVLMKKSLDKTEQCSDWADRPLTATQMEYAALDAAVARPLLLMTLEEEEKEQQQQQKASTADSSFAEDTGKTSFLIEHNELRQTIRMLFLRREGTYDKSIRYRVVRGHDRTQLGVRYARQSWPTGTSPPEEPTQLEKHDDEDVSASAPPNNGTPNGATKSKAKTSKRRTRKTQRGTKPMPLKQLSGDLDDLPPAGELVGYTKDDCVEAVLGATAVNSLADNFSFRFNRRGGIVEMSNAWLLFISFSGYTREWKYKNEFSNGGRCINFSVDTQRGFKENDLPFLWECGCLDESLEYVPEVKPSRQILLFARRDTDSKFLYCGRCVCREWTSPAMGEYDVQLELVDFDDLCQSPEYPYMGEGVECPDTERQTA